MLSDLQEILVILAGSQVGKMQWFKATIPSQTPGPLLIRLNPAACTVLMYHAH